MMSQKGGRTRERRKRVAPSSNVDHVRGAVLGWAKSLQPARFLLCFATIVVLSALLLVPLPRRGAAVATYVASHPGATLITAPAAVTLVRDTPSPADTSTPVARWASQTVRLSNSLVVGVVLLVALMAGFVGLYLHRFHPTLYESTSRLTLLALLVGLCVLGLKVGGMMLGVNLSGLQFGYISLLCIAACAMVTTVLLDGSVALVLAAILSILSMLILGNELRFCLMTYVGSLVAVLSVSAIKTRGDVVRAGMLLAATNVVLTFLLGQVTGDSWADIAVGSLWGFVAGVLCVALFTIGVAIFEKPFGVTTHVGLLELSDPNRPLLKAFAQACPGTFAHSISVGNLAAAAAEAIDADALLCRVSAYYHDIGKMRRAQFFAENQSGENAHERITPSLSALIVTAHVKEGMEIAHENRLPQAIKDIIVQHHGTSLIRYFFHRATCDGQEQRSALEQQFRYPGPKPQTREAAIMMLADGVEAASHVLERPTPARVTEFVQKMIDEKVADGQFDEAPLTLRDLNAIKDAFVRILCGMLHSRVEYPDMPGKVQRGKALQQDENTASAGSRPAGTGDTVRVSDIVGDIDASQRGFKIDGPID